MNAKAERAEKLRAELHLLEAFRGRVVKFAPLVGSDGALWVDRLREYMYAELSTLEAPDDKTHATRVAWAVLYAMYEHSNSTSATPKDFAKAAGLSVKTLERCRRAAPARVKTVYEMHDAEIRLHFERFADQLGLKGKRRDDVQQVTLTRSKPPRVRKVP